MGLSRLKLVFPLIGFIWVSGPVLAATKGYKDVPNSHWAKNSVAKLVDEYQFMSGDPNGNFRGTQALSRYEFAKTIANMVEYYNREIEADRKDLENVVGVLELFQGEMKKIDGKFAQANTQVESQNKTIAELNELVLTLAEELNAIETDEEGGIKTQLDDLKVRVADVEANVNELSDKGLVVDTLVKGAGNDVKHLGLAVASAARKTSHLFNREDKAEEASEVKVESTTTTTTTESEANSLQKVEGQLADPAVQVAPVPAQPSQLESTQEFINNLDGYYAAPADKPVEFLTPVH